MLRLQIGKWGNSLAIRLPVALSQKFMFKEGDILNATMDANGGLQLTSAQTFDKSAFLVTLDALHQDLPETQEVVDQLRQEQRY